MPPLYTRRRGDSSAGTSRAPKNAFACASTASGVKLVRWKYRIARSVRRSACPSGGPGRLEAPQGEGVEDDGQTRPRHRRTRQDRRQQHPQERKERSGGDAETEGVVDERPEEVDTDRPQGAPRELDRRRHLA